MLDKLLAGEDANLQILRKQLALAEVVQRVNTGVGFYIRFGLPQNVERLTNRQRITLGDVNADVEGLNFGIGFVLFISDGALEMLEGYTYDERWPDEIKRYDLNYIDGTVRNLSRAIAPFVVRQ